MTRRYTSQDIEQLCRVPGANQYFTVERWADAQAALKEAQELDAAGRHAEAAVVEKEAAALLPEAALAYGHRCEEGRGVAPSRHDAVLWYNAAMAQANRVSFFVSRDYSMSSRLTGAMMDVREKAAKRLAHLAPRPVVHFAVSGVQQG